MITLHEGEKIILEKRKYWFPLIAEASFLLIAVLLPLFTLFLLDALPAVLDGIDEMLASYRYVFLFFEVAFLLFVWIIFFVSWTNYYLDIVIITNKRVIDIQQLGLFARDSAELRIENIQDIKVEIIGIIPSLLHYGNISIQSAGEKTEFVLHHVQDPHAVKDIIARQHDLLATK